MKNSLQKNSHPGMDVVTSRVYITWITRCFFTLACIVFLSSASKAQSGSWTLLKNQNSVAVYCKAELCPNTTDSIVFLRIVNSGSAARSVSWSLWGGTPGAAFASPANQERSGSCASGPFLGEAIPSGKTSADIDANITIE
jgi:hypothetical protein